MNFGMAAARLVFGPCGHVQGCNITRPKYEMRCETARPKYELARPENEWHNSKRIMAVPRCSPPDWAIPLKKIVHLMGDDKWCPGGGGEGGGGGCWKYDVVEGGV